MQLMKTLARSMECMSTSIQIPERALQSNGLEIQLFNPYSREKIDTTHDEALLLEPVRQSIHPPYSDEPEDGLHSYCYAFEEVFAEKTRALIERAT